ncbi:MAG: DUF5700 domain-containing putative Zn-dependent protease [Candidatus Bipolaricaulaceae bacterium]
MPPGPQPLREVASPLLDTRTWGELAAAAEGTCADVSALKGLICLDDLQTLLGEMARLEDPGQLLELTAYQERQEAWGAGFCGMLPDQLTGADLPVPRDVGSLLRAAQELAQVRRLNLEAVARVDPGYPLEFRGQSLPPARTQLPPDWGVELDLTAIRATVGLMEEGAAGLEDARRVARLPAFREMMAHRRNLGFIPEPLVDEDSLAHLLLHAASRAPLDMIWKWLNPQNLFDLADVFLHRRQFAALADELAGRADEVAAHVLAPLARYAPAGTAFRDRITFTVGWGIAGWATLRTCGVNLEHFKDNYQQLFTSLSHELFHRLQLQVCPRHPGGGGDGFAVLVQWPLADAADRKLYEALAYIFLEGTATFVAPPHPPQDQAASARHGATLLQQCYQALYEQGDLEAAESLINEGLRSNGPFYWLGAQLAAELVASAGDGALGEALTAGPLHFFLRAVPHSRLLRTICPGLLDKVNALAGQG